MKSVSRRNFGFAFLTAGCGTTYYRITDPATGKNYYLIGSNHAGKATEPWRNRGMNNGSRVTSQSSDVKVNAA